MQSRHDRFVKELKKHGSDFLNTLSNRTSLITITRIDLSADTKRSTFFISVLPETKEAEALEFLNRRARDAQHYIGDKIKVRRTPSVTFVLDQGEKNRQRIDELLANS